MLTGVGSWVMKCPSSEATERTSGETVGVLAQIAPRVVFHSRGSEYLAISELVLEAEIKQRAEVITEVLARIIEHPTPPRYWEIEGLCGHDRCAPRCAGQSQRTDEVGRYLDDFC